MIHLRSSRRRRLAGTVLAGLLVTACAEEDSARGTGVDEDTIRLGTHVPLSGPVAQHGEAMWHGMKMRVDEINEAGGIHGRRLELIVEDNQYQQSKAVQAGEKLLKRDRVFALIGALGTRTNMVTMPRALEAGVPNLFPASFAREMSEPFHRLKFANLTPYYHQMRGVVRYFVAEQGKERIGVLYQDDDYGKDVRDGVVDQLDAEGLELVAETTFEPGDRSFGAQIARLRSSGADLVVLGTIITETIGAMSEARKLGWEVDFVVSSAGYTHHVVTMAQGATAGLYGATHTPLPDPATAGAELGAWIERLEQHFDREPDMSVMNGYVAIDLFAIAAEAAGPDLDIDGLVEGLESIRDYRDIFGGPLLNFGPEKHLGCEPRESAQLHQVVDGRWVKVAELRY